MKRSLRLAATLAAIALAFGITGATAACSVPDTTKTKVVGIDPKDHCHIQVYTALSVNKAQWVKLAPENRADCDLIKENDAYERDGDTTTIVVKKSGKKTSLDFAVTDAPAPGSTK